MVARGASGGETASAMSKVHLTVFALTGITVSTGDQLLRNKSGMRNDAAVAAIVSFSRRNEIVTSLPSEPISLSPSGQTEAVWAYGGQEAILSLTKGSQPGTKSMSDEEGWYDVTVGLVRGNDTVIIGTSRFFVGSNFGTGGATMDIKVEPIDDESVANSSFGEKSKGKKGKSWFGKRKSSSSKSQKSDSSKKSELAFPGDSTVYRLGTWSTLRMVVVSTERPRAGRMVYTDSRNDVDEVSVIRNEHFAVGAPARHPLGLPKDLLIPSSSTPPLQGHTRAINQMAYGDDDGLFDDFTVGASTIADFEQLEELRDNFRRLLDEDTLATKSVAKSKSTLRKLNRDGDPERRDPSPIVEASFSLEDRDDVREAAVNTQRRDKRIMPIFPMGCGAFGNVSGTTSGSIESSTDSGSIGSQTAASIDRARQVLSRHGIVVSDRELIARPRKTRQRQRSVGGDTLSEGKDSFFMGCM